MIRRIILLAVILSSGLFRTIARTPSDTLTLSDIIQRIQTSYPAIMQSDADIEVSAIRLKMARSSYLPTIAGKASYSYIDPISALNLGSQTIHIQSNHNTAIGVSLSQLIWDFGKSRPQIEAAQIEKDLAVLEKQQLLQSLTLQGIQGYYLTAFSRKSIRIKEEQLHNFKQMLEQTMLRKQAGSATNFDYLNTNAGLQAVKSELIALGAEKEKQYINLGMLADTTISDNTPLSLYFIRKQEKRSLEELITFALENRMEMKIMRKNIELAHLQKKTADRSFNPTLSAGISGGFNNGYEPNINKLRANFAVGATLEVPLYEGGKRKQNIGLANAQINKSTATLTLTEKEITRQVADSYFTLVSAAASLEQLKVQDLVSQEAYQQARTNYQAGTLTNLELVTSATNATNARLLLLQEEINYQIAWYGLLVNLGILIYNTDGN